jgi:competence protein ComEC
LDSDILFDSLRGPLAHRLAIGATYVVFALGIAASAARAQPGEAIRRGFDIYLVDVEGGGATLLVTPAGQAVLIDGGWATPNRRDSKRVLAVAHRAGVDRLDYVIVSHYHSDHLGGVVELAPHISVGEFLDHGLMEQPLPYVSTELYSQYIELSRGRRSAVRPGEIVQLRGLEGEPAPSLLVLASNRLTYSHPGAPRNRACTQNQHEPVDSGENANSVAVLVRYGAFRYFDGADLPWIQEAKLACPRNEVGAVNVYQVDHHGKDTSGNPALIAGLHPQVALMNNGPDKGGDPATFDRLRKFLNVRDVFQVHRNLATSAKENAPSDCVANPGVNDGGFGFQIHVSDDGKSYEVINERTNQVRHYATAR